jgi:phosphatidate cytidylyltransferase
MDESSTAESPRQPTEPGTPNSDRVRISGADVAGERTGELPAVSRADAPTGSAAAPTGGEPTVHVTGEPAADRPPEGAVDPVVPGETAVPGGGPASGGPASPVLPHWTEPPTGEVPAVLARDGGEQKGLMGPTWREEDADWVAHEEEFEPGMFGGEHEDLGSLNETDSAAVERRPWEFDLAGVRPGDPGPGDPGPAEPPAGRGPEDGAPPAIDPVTAEVPAVGRVSEPGVVSQVAPPDEPTVASERAFGRVLGEPTAMVPAVAAAGSGQTEPGAPSTPGLDPADEVPTTDAAPARARPTGTTRLGRARRNGLRPGRLRAKRPEDVPAVAEPPLAAEPPGAAVTEVPGAGRKRGLASLAAADRTAERAEQAAADAASPAYELPAESHVGAATAAAAAAPGVRERRRLVGHRTRGPEDGTSAPGPPRPRRPPGANGNGAVPAGDPRRSLALRVGTGLAVGLVAAIAFKLGTVPSLIVAMALVTVAAGECFGVLRRAGYQPATLLGLVGTIALMWGAYAKGISAIPAVLVLITFFTLVWYLTGVERSPVAGSAATLLTTGWIALLGAYAALLLAPSIFPNRHGIAFLLGAAIAAVTNDVSALAIGSWIGSRPLAPRISPNKTWEGLIGSAVVTVVVCTVVVGAIHPWDPATAALLGLVAAVFAPLGDLCESMLKRDLHLKDMGTLLPGHGGVLDRLDALIFVVPATYYLVRALNIG